MLYTLKRIWRAAYKAVKMPMSRLHSSRWDYNDHAHICLAARLLEPDDFRKVCKAQKHDIEHCDDCDDCYWFTLIRFMQSVGGRKMIWFE